MSSGLTDIPGLFVGHATDLDGITGCTAVLCPEGAVGGVDIRGSATASQELDLLNPQHVTPALHAIVLAGGSAFGLEAASGVRRYLEGRGIGFKTGAAVVPLVTSACIYDLSIGKASARPNREMGEAAARAASDADIAEGAVGAGTGATVGKILGMRHAMKSGLGTASVWLDGDLSGIRVSALAVVNAIGDVRDPETGHILAGTRREPGSRDLADSAAILKRGVKAGFSQSQSTNTTLVIVGTNAKLSKVGTTKLAQLASLGVARTINPIWTMSDGDITFALSIGQQQAPIDSLGVAAAEAVSNAVLRAVRKAPGMGGLPGLAE
ncbi:MAG: P1 family peptidase [Bryobacterales bacterium]|nr:P1 family peptidase [Bryobacterales bacterium]